MPVQPLSSKSENKVKVEKVTLASFHSLSLCHTLETKNMNGVGKHDSHSNKTKKVIVYAEGESKVKAIGESKVKVWSVK